MSILAWIIFGLIATCLAGVLAAQNKQTVRVKSADPGSPPKP